MTKLDNTPAPTKDQVRYAVRVTAKKSLREISSILSDAMRDLDDEAWVVAQKDWQAAHKALGDVSEALGRMARRLDA